MDQSTYTGKHRDTSRRATLRGWLRDQLAMVALRHRTPRHSSEVSA